MTGRLNGRGRSALAACALATLAACNPLLAVDDVLMGEATASRPDVVASGQAGAAPSNTTRKDVSALSRSGVVVVDVRTANGLQCNGFLSGAGQVLTAAHCLSGSGAPGSVTFADGSRVAAQPNGVNQAWSMASGDPQRQSGLDVGRMRISPVSGGPRPRFLQREFQPGEMVELLAERGGVSRPCSVLGQTGSLVEVRCQVREGWSGAPILVRDGSTTCVAGLLSGMGQGALSSIAVASHASVVSYVGDAALLP